MTGLAPPVYPELKEYIKSPIADLKNTSNIKAGSKHRGGILAPVYRRHHLAI